MGSWLCCFSFFRFLIHRKRFPGAGRKLWCWAPASRNHPAIVRFQEAFQTGPLSIFTFLVKFVHFIHEFMAMEIPDEFMEMVQLQIVCDQGQPAEVLEGHKLLVQNPPAVIFTADTVE